MSMKSMLVFALGAVGVGDAESGLAFLSGFRPARPGDRVSGRLQFGIGGHVGGDCDPSGVRRSFNFRAYRRRQDAASPLRLSAA
jgi:hypothetical protein